MKLIWRTENFRVETEVEGRWVWKINEQNENQLPAKYLLSYLLMQSLPALLFIFHLWENELNNIIRASQAISCTQTFWYSDINCLVTLDLYGF
jgi:hypothetical protein